MRAVVQRVSEATCTVNGVIVSKIGAGILVLIGISKDDGIHDIEYIVKKLLNLRIFEDEKGKMNLSLKQINGEIMIISQFTLYGDARKGTRPSFTAAAGGDYAKTVYSELIDTLTSYTVPIHEGIFGAHMDISLINNGPVTILLDSRREF